jgi:DNA-directed RNA polymerase sigma subunit (sigma70/sigma32)
MRSYPWPTDAGWPYPDGRTEAEEVGDQVDDDLIALQAGRPSLFARLTQLERDVVTLRYGLDGEEARTMAELRDKMGISKHEVRDVLGSGLAKLRQTLGA